MSQASTGEQSMLQNLTQESWKPHLNQLFQIHYENAEPLSMTLVEVTGLSDKPGQARQAFSIVFSGPGERAVASGHL